MARPRRRPPSAAALEGKALEDAALMGWHTLNPLLMDLTRLQVARLLVAERQGQQREKIMNRLHQRLCLLRRKAEWESLMEDGVPEWLAVEARVKREVTS